MRSPERQQPAAYYPGVPGDIDHVFLDIGGVLYDDRVYAEAWRRALRESGATFTHAACDTEKAPGRSSQDRSFRVHLTKTFLGPEADVRDVGSRAARYWQYPA